MNDAGQAAISQAQLRSLDALVERAVAENAEADLPTLGFGEISLVLGWPAEEPRLACKRLPPFRSREQFESYRATLVAYLERLDAAGVRVVPSEMHGVERADGTVAGYVVQPVLAAASLAPAVLRSSDPATGHPLVGSIVERVAAVVSPQVGFDAQLSNWAWDGSEPIYLDVSTPLLWSDSGEILLDVSVLAQAFPAPLRPPLRRFLAPRILDSYRDRRSVLMDLAANLLKERLEPWLEPFLAAASARLSEPIRPEEARAYYRSDARLWEVLLRIRRLDRAWRRRTGRPYPFLLPGKIER